MKQGIPTWRQLGAALALLGLAFRALVPDGYMLARQGDSMTVTLCPVRSAELVSFLAPSQPEHHHHHHHHAPAAAGDEAGQGSGSAGCAYALAAAAPPPAAITATSWFLPADTQPVARATWVARRPSALLPPATGPPVFSLS